MRHAVVYAVSVAAVLFLAARAVAEARLDDGSVSENDGSVSRKCRADESLLGVTISLQPRGHDGGSLVRDALVFAISLVVVLFLAAYAVADPGLEIAMAANVVHTGSPRAATILGNLRDADGGALKGASIEASAPAGTRMGRLDRGGAFRIALLRACTTYRVVVHGRSSGRSVSARLDRRLCPGDELDLDARVVANGQLIWMPIR